jgi:hypothetical protein
MRHLQGSSIPLIHNPNKSTAYNGRLAPQVLKPVCFGNGASGNDILPDAPVSEGELVQRYYRFIRLQRRGFNSSILLSHSGLAIDA